MTGPRPRLNGPRHSVDRYLDHVDFTPAQSQDTHSDPGDTMDDHGCAHVLLRQRNHAVQTTTVRRPVPSTLWIGRERSKQRKVKIDKLGTKVRKSQTFQRGMRN